MLMPIGKIEKIPTTKSSNPMNSGLLYRFENSVNGTQAHKNYIPVVVDLFIEISIPQLKCLRIHLNDYALCKGLCRCIFYSLSFTR